MGDKVPEREIPKESTAQEIMNDKNSEKFINAVHLRKARLRLQKKKKSKNEAKTEKNIRTGASEMRMKDRIDTRRRKNKIRRNAHICRKNAII